MKIWVDFSNSPHPLMFAPVVRRLEQEGHDVLLTARDNAQTAQLAFERWAHVEVIGGESPGSRVEKTAALVRRVRDLQRWARTRQPDVALSHNSYAQIVAAALLRIRIVTAMDFEHQPANHLAFRLASEVLLPEAVPLRCVERQGATAAKIVRYPGLKEELYTGDFVPDRLVLEGLGLDPRPKTVAIVRTPPSRAIYHRFGNPIFGPVLEAVASQPDTVCVVLARHAEQRESVANLRLAACIAPDAAIDSRSLIYHADAMIGAGGTMTREAAVMGIPTWSVFAGEPPAVDRWLEQQGRLSRLTDADQLREVGPRRCSPREPSELRQRAEAIERVFVMATVGRRVRPPPEVQLA